MTTTRTDKELILDYQKGNHRAFEVLHTRYADKLYTFILHQVGNTSAEDLFQDMMLKAQKHLTRFDPDGNFRAWLVKIAVNRIHDFRRKENRMKKIFTLTTNQSTDMDGIGNSLTTEIAGKTDEIPDYADNEISELLNSAIKKLPENQREVVNLHYLMGLSFREIAEILGYSINTISARARYGLKNIKKILGPVLLEELT